MHDKHPVEKNNKKPADSSSISGVFLGIGLVFGVVALGSNSDEKPLYLSFPAKIDGISQNKLIKEIIPDHKNFLKNLVQKEITTIAKKSTLKYKQNAFTDVGVTYDRKAFISEGDGLISLTFSDPRIKINVTDAHHEAFQNISRYERDNLISNVRKVVLGELIYHPDFDKTLQRLKDEDHAKYRAPILDNLK